MDRSGWCFGLFDSNILLLRRPARWDRDRRRGVTGMTGAFTTADRGAGHRALSCKKPTAPEND
jgi:hypothetical protein